MVNNAAVARSAPARLDAQIHMTRRTHGEHTSSISPGRTAAAATLERAEATLEFATHLQWVRPALGATTRDTPRGLRPQRAHPSLRLEVRAAPRCPRSQRDTPRHRARMFGDRRVLRAARHTRPIASLAVDRRVHRRTTLAHTPPSTPRLAPSSSPLRPSLERSTPAQERQTRDAPRPCRT